LEATCPALVGTNTCYTTYVLDPTNYANAYFEMASVKIFATDPSAVSTAASSSTPTSTAGGTSGPASTGHSAAKRTAATDGMTVLVGTMALAFGGAIMGYLSIGF